MEYFEKLDQNPYEDLKWNIPEQKQGIISIIGGNSSSFRTEVKIAEYVTNSFPIREARLILPDILKNKLPSLPYFAFMPSTDSGSLAESQALLDSFSATDFNLVLGDLSRNTTTGKAISDACRNAEKMTLITRDAIDLLADNDPGRWLMNENLILMASVVQLQKLLRAVYYPKMLLASSSLIQVAELLHKFTLSYPVAIITLHNEQVLVAQNGTVKAVPLAKTGYSPITFWSGEAAAKTALMNLYSPNQFIKASISALFYQV